MDAGFHPDPLSALRLLHGLALRTLFAGVSTLAAVPVATLAVLAASPAVAGEGVLEAQDVPDEVVVEGLVLDSAQAAPEPGVPPAAGAVPLAGARVRVSGVDEVVVTDSAGRFSVAVPGPGTWTFTFDHARLDSLGILNAGWTPVRVTGEGPTRVELAIPSYPTLLALMCERVPGAGEDAIVGGRVFLSGRPAADVVMDLRSRGQGPEGQGVTLAELSEEDGMFLFCSVPAETDLALAGNLTQDAGDGGTFRLEPGEILALDVRLSEGGAGQLTGTVQDGRTGSPLPDAVVMVEGDGEGSGGVVSDAQGRFSVPPLPAGVYTVRVEHLAYRQVTDTVRVPGGDAAVRLEVSLLADAIPLDPIAVQVESRSTVGRLGDVYDRMDRMRQLGLGRIFDRGDIEDAGAIRVSHLVAQLPGVQTHAIAGSPNLVLRLTRNECDPSVYVDGVRWTGQGVDEAVTVGELEAVEVYRRISEIPGEFWDEQATRCGVVAVWTRRGR